MKPRLVIGLGNPLMGDDGAGYLVAARLAEDPRLPGDVEVIAGGTDLLRYAAATEGRTQVAVIDAMQDDGEPGRLLSLDLSCSGLETREENVHQLSAVEAIRLLQLTAPVPFLLLGISISSARAGSELTPALAARIPEIVNQVLQLILAGAQ
jgi:hydrogenase maturation protease